MTARDAIQLLGGIALFLYGMSIMGSGLERVAGGKMQSILQKLTASTLRGVLLGALITAVIQSSAGTIVIVIGLVNSGIMALPQAVGVIMGANIGTTVTGQLIRLADISGDSLLLTIVQPRTFAPIVAFVGAILYVFFSKPSRRNVGQIMMGFGILFTGMFQMEGAVAGLKESALFVELFTSLQNPILGVLAGIGPRWPFRVPRPPSAFCRRFPAPARSPSAAPSPSSWGPMWAPPSPPSWLLRAPPARPSAAR